MPFRIGSRSQAWVGASVTEVVGGAALVAGPINTPRYPSSVQLIPHTSHYLTPTRSELIYIRCPVCFTWIYKFFLIGKPRDVEQLKPSMDVCIWIMSSSVSFEKSLAFTDVASVFRRWLVNQIVYSKGNKPWKRGTHWEHTHKKKLNSLSQFGVTVFRVRLSGKACERGCRFRTYLNVTLIRSSLTSTVSRSWQHLPKFLT